MKPAATPSASPPPATYDPMDWARQTGESAALVREIRAKLQVRRRKRVRAARTAAGVAAAAFLLLWGVPWLRDTSRVATPAAQRQTLALDDGSTAELNARTSVRMDFRYGRRTVHLSQGEAFFSVTRDAGHPFVVETPHGAIRVTGTRFNVRLDGDQRPEITLYEGSVSVEKLTPAPLTLVPGQQLSAAGAAPSVRTLAPAELETLTAWRQGRIVLEGLSLAQAAARFAAYHGRVIAVADEVGRFRMGGVCPLDDLEKFFSALEESVAVKVTPRGDGSYHIGPREISR